MGKTALEYQILTEYRAKGGNALVIDRQKQFGRYSVWPGLANLEEYLDTKVMHGRYNGLLGLDDADIYMTSRSKAVFRDLIAAFRHHGLDLFVSARMPQGIDTTLLACLDIICVFHMTSPHGREHLDELLSDQLPGVWSLSKIPNKPFEYLECNLTAKTMTLKHTRPMGELK